MADSVSFYKFPPIFTIWKENRAFSFAFTCKSKMSECLDDSEFEFFSSQIIAQDATETVRFLKYVKTVGFHGKKWVHKFLIWTWILLKLVEVANLL